MICASENVNLEKIEQNIIALERKSDERVLKNAGKKRDNIMKRILRRKTKLIGRYNEA